MSRRLGAVSEGRETWRPLCPSLPPSHTNTCHVHGGKPNGRRATLRTRACGRLCVCVHLRTPRFHAAVAHVRSLRAGQRLAFASAPRMHVSVPHELPLRCFTCTKDSVLCQCARAARHRKPSPPPPHPPHTATPPHRRTRAHRATAAVSAHHFRSTLVPQPTLRVSGPRAASLPAKIPGGRHCPSYGQRRPHAYTLCANACMHLPH